MVSSLHTQINMTKYSFFKNTIEKEKEKAIAFNKAIVLLLNKP